MPDRPVAAEAREAFRRWVDAAGDRGRVFLQTWVARRERPGYEIRHVDDRDAPREELDVRTSHGDARSIAAVTADGRHRPLKTAPDLRGGWALVGLTARQMWDAYNHLYPATVVHWHQGRTGGLPTTSYYETAGRQTGIYSRVDRLSPAEVRRARAACCDDAVCLRRVRWTIGEDGTPTRPEDGDTADGGDDARSGGREAGSPPGGGDESPRGDADVPCPEPCSLFIALARKLLADTEEETPPPGADLRPPERREVVRALRRAARMSRDHPGGPRTGDLDDPLNPRRLLYLARRVEEAGGETEP